ncbi:conserved protein of unknown function [Rhodovastum atsumiense]|uniref:Uncharacterized protein n=1 Tax=Rhodovastum atsumiense TaxID=504468 RepID=A0A5M6J0M9_9PROT|nr:hypothetical protein [Rhodovastum atsumiense]KAA5614132.1 hypothetical protein F1189_02745 [Rhodovastum atsumiense]CAH2598981.1 conserved protein of unknown function [Rhodovastum atsumiense]
MNVPLQFVRVRDRDGEIAIGRDDLVRYSGPEQVVASALCLRLFGRAFADLSPEAPPLRTSIRVLSAFPGEGMLDGIEMITRARSRGALVVDPQAAAVQAPSAGIGRFYFVVAVDDRARGYMLAPDLFTADFIRQVAAFQDGGGTAAERAAYQAAKHSLIGRLLGTGDDELWRSCEAPVPAPPPDRTVQVRDHGACLKIDFEDCVKFHGRSNIGGLALGLRLMQRAFADLSPGGPPDRSEISVRTAFPGLGLRDAVEMIARAGSRGSYTLDLAMAPPSAPEAALGRLWFEVTIGSARAAYVTPPGAMGEDFISLARLSHERSLTPPEALRWQELKEQLAARLLALSPHQALLPG